MQSIITNKKLLRLKNMIEFITRVIKQSLIDEPLYHANINSLLKMYITVSLIGNAHQKV